MSHIARLKVLTDAQSSGVLTFTQIEKYKLLVKSDLAEITIWLKSGIWATNVDYGHGKASAGIDKALSYLKDPSGFVFDAPAIEPYRTPRQRMDDGIDLVSSLNVEFKILGDFCIRITISNGYVDYWPTTSKWSINSGKTRIDCGTLLPFIKKAAIGQDGIK